MDPALAGSHNHEEKYGHRYEDDPKYKDFPAIEGLPSLAPFVAKLQSKRFFFADSLFVLVG